jgi:hypothetical protein
MGGSHRTLIGLRLPIKHATADILNLSLDKTLFRSAHAKTDKVTIGKPNFKVVAASSKNVFCRSDLVSGE